MYVLPGKVDKYMLEDFAPVKDARENLETHEILKVFFTVYQLDTIIPGGSDATQEDVEDIADNLTALMDAGRVIAVEKGKVEMSGLLPIPFEDFYNLTGTEREDYLAAKAAAQEEIRRLTEACHAAGLDDEETEQWLRFNLYASDDEDDEE